MLIIVEAYSSSACQELLAASDVESHERQKHSRYESKFRYWESLPRFSAVQGKRCIAALIKLCSNSVLRPILEMVNHITRIRKICRIIFFGDDRCTCCLAQTHDVHKRSWPRGRVKNIGRYQRRWSIVNSVKSLKKLHEARDAEIRETHPKRYRELAKKRIHPLAKRRSRKEARQKGLCWLL